MKTTPSFSGSVTAAALAAVFAAAGLSVMFSDRLSSLHPSLPVVSVAAVSAAVILLLIFRRKGPSSREEAELKIRIEEEVKNNRNKDHLLIEQARMAAMGELLVALSHTWRQPLNTMALILANIKDLFEYGELDETRMRKLSGDADMVLQKLSTTIDDFRSFHSLKQEVTDFIVHDVLIESLTVTQSVFAVNSIEVKVEILEGLSVRGIPGRFAQALLNILFNARDSLTAAHIKNPSIKINLHQEDHKAVLSITDSGPGMSAEVLRRAFDPYFTTKKNAAGIGLYMAQMVVHEMNGRIEALNGPEGFTVKITLPLSDENRSG